MVRLFHFIVTSKRDSALTRAVKNTAEHHTKYLTNQLVMKTSTALPDRIADYFIASIAAEKIRPGAKLPPYRTLAQLLNVDQTSLRMALRILVRMGLVSPVQGSGMTVNDYRQVAGLDFLDNLYQIEELQLGQEILNSAIDLFVEITPRMLPEVLPNLSDERRLEFSVLIKKLQQAAESGAPAATLAQLDVALFDLLTQEMKNLFAQLAANSSRSLRIKITQTLYENLDAQTHVGKLKQIFMGAIMGEISSENIEPAFREVLANATHLLQQEFSQQPLKPVVTQPILPDTATYLELT